MWPTARAKIAGSGDGSSGAPAHVAVASAGSRNPKPPTPPRRKSKKKLPEKSPAVTLLAPTASTGSHSNVVPLRALGVAQTAVIAAPDAHYGVAQQGVAHGGSGNPAGHAAVAAFVASLGAAPGNRVPAGALQDAYVTHAATNGWPTLGRTALGILLRIEIEAMGGRKIKSSGQFYEGVSLPPALAVAS